MKKKKSIQSAPSGMRGVSTKKYNPNANKPKAKISPSAEEKPAAQNPKRKKVIIASILASVIFVATVLSVVLYIVNRPFNYLSASLSSYLTLSRDDYVGYELTEEVKKPTEELELEEAILKALVNNKSKDALYGGNYILNEPIEAGSAVKLWYYGYYLDEDGNKVSAGAGTSNFSSATASELVIGSGSFVSGFEIGLIGKNMKDYSGLKPYYSGKILENDIVILSLTAYYPDGKAEQITSGIFDLSQKEQLDAKYGEGFTDSVLALSIGDKNKAVRTTYGDASAVFSISVNSAVRPMLPIYEGSFTAGDIVYLSYNVESEGVIEEKRTKTVLSESVINSLDGAMKDLLSPLLNGGGIGEAFTHTVTHEGKTYSDVKVVCKYVNQNKPITVKTYFPYDYREKSLRNREIYFDVYVDGVIYYEVPTLDDKFIKETLKITEESLKEYEGDTIVEKYKSMLMDGLMHDYEYAVSASLEEAAWEHLMSRAVFKKLPEREIEDVYNAYKLQLTTYYNQNKEYLSSLDDAAKVLFGFDGSESTEDALRSLATTDVKEKIIFYYIAREEKLLPSKKEFKELYEKQYQLILEDYLVSVYCLPEYFLNEEDYREAVKYYEKEMQKYYTEQSISEALYYEIVMPEIVKLAGE